MSRARIRLRVELVFPAEEAPGAFFERQSRA
jgi:hypothetical protein